MISFLLQWTLENAYTSFQELEKNKGNGHKWQDTAVAEMIAWLLSTPFFFIKRAYVWALEREALKVFKNYFELLENIFKEMHQ